MAIHDILRGKINRVAETQFFLRPRVEIALKQQALTDEGRKYVGDFANCYEYWTSTFAHHFFDMGTLIRLGSAIEDSLRDYYMFRVGHVTAVDLAKDRRYVSGTFQRIVPTVKNGRANYSPTSVINLYKDAFGCDLLANSDFPSVQEMMLHRHLYAHNSGRVDDAYIERVRVLTGRDIRPRVVEQGYPGQDVIWLEPLGRLPEFIDTARRFVRSLSA